MLGLRVAARLPRALRRLSVSVERVGMPSLSPTMTAGTIASWKKQPGEALKAGDVLCEIETDKASVGFEVQDDGVLAKILVEAKGPEIECGKPIALLVGDAEAYAAFLKMDPSEYAAAGASSAAAAAPAAAPAAAVAAVAAAPAAKTGRTPLIKFVGKRSKHAPAAAPAAAAAATTTTVAAAVPTIATSDAPVNNSYTDVPNSNMRKVIAKRLTESKSTVPHFYVQLDCEIDALLALRKTLKAQFDSNVSVNDLVVKSAALALRDLPHVAAKWNKALGAVEPSAAAAVSDIAVAVATPNGLITPIVKAAHELGVAQVNERIKDLAGRAREGKLKPEEYQGGSFSISNLGMFGISVFSAVINPPQACILAVGAGIPRVLPPSGGKTKPRVATVVSVQLSADRRVVDEASAALFLQVFGDYLSNPRQTIL